MSLPSSPPYVKPTTTDTAKPGTQPDPDANTRDGFAAYVRKEYNRRLEERRPFEAGWLLNIAFVEGNQYAEIHKNTGELYTRERKHQWEQRDVFNNIAAVFETRTAKLTRNRPRMSVIPGGADQEDINAAKVSQRLLQYNQDEQHMDGLLAEAAAWAELTGTAFFKTLWNPGKGQVLSDPQGGENVPLGDVETVVCNSFEIFPENTLKPRLEDQRSFIHAKAWPLDSDHVQALSELFQQQSGQELKSQAEDVKAVTVGRNANAMNGLPELRFSVANLKNHVTVIEYYERPSRKWPQGRFAIVLGQDLVYLGNLPYQEDLDFPFDKVDSIRRPNCFWSKSVIERLIPIQRRYNAVRNRMQEFLNRCGIGQWVAEAGTVDIGMLTNEPGLVIEYARGSRPPSPVQFPPLPSTFMEEVRSLEQEFMQVSGMHEVSHAQLPTGSGGSPSGVLVAQLQEQDDTRLATTQRYMEEAIERMGRRWLLRYKEFVNEQRTFQVMGRNKAVQILDFDANTIRSCNVKVEASAALANSPSARRDMVFAMLDRGLFNNPTTGTLDSQALQKVFSMLEFGNWEDYKEDEALPQNRSQFENHMMQMGQVFQVLPWENHLVHMYEHNLFRQTDDFYKLMESPDGQLIAMMFDQHVQMHMMAIQGVLPPTPGQAPAPGETMQPPMMAPPGPEVMTPPAEPAGMSPDDIILEAARIEKEQGTEAAEAFMHQMAGEMMPSGAQVQQ